MRHFLYDDSGDKQLIEYLNQHVTELKARIILLESQQKELSDALLAARMEAAKPALAPAPKVLTKADAARSLGLPAWAVDQIDFERIGEQFTIEPTERKH